jgi:hypothetical protein
LGAPEIISLVWVAALLVLIVLIRVKRRARRHGGSLQAGVAGAMYEWQNRDKQKALEVVVDAKHAKKRPESPGEPPEPES